jgi:hypothetical protein
MAQPPIKQNVQPKPVIQSQQAVNGQIWGFEKNLFIEIVKWGAIAGLVSGAIEYVATLLGLLFSWFGLFGGSTFNFSSLIRTVFEGAIFGAFVLLIVIKYHDKSIFAKFNSLFMKLFIPYLILDLVLYFLFGGIFLIFSGPLTFLFFLIGAVVGDYVFAKIAAKKVGPLVGM